MLYCISAENSVYPITDLIDTLSNQIYGRESWFEYVKRSVNISPCV